MSEISQHFDENQSKNDFIARQFVLRTKKSSRNHSFDGRTFSNEKPKNVFCLMIDGLNLGFLGPFGNRWIDTPGCCSLACESVLFDQFYIPSLNKETIYRSYWTDDLFSSEVFEEKAGKGVSNIFEKTSNVFGSKKTEPTNSAQINLEQKNSDPAKTEKKDFEQKLFLPAWYHSQGYKTVLLTDDPEIPAIADRIAQSFQYSSDECSKNDSFSAFDECFVLENPSRDFPADDLESTQFYRMFQKALSILKKQSEKTIASAPPIFLWGHFSGWRKIWDFPLSFRERYRESEDDPMPYQGTQVPFEDSLLAIAEQKKTQKKREFFSTLTSNSSSFSNIPVYEKEEIADRSSFRSFRRKKESEFWDSDVFLPGREAYCGGITVFDAVLKVFLSSFKKSALDQSTYFLLGGFRGFPTGEHLRLGFLPEQFSSEQLNAENLYQQQSSEQELPEQRSERKISTQKMLEHSDSSPTKSILTSDLSGLSDLSESPVQITDFVQEKTFFNFPVSLGYSEEIHLPFFFRFPDGSAKLTRNSSLSTPRDVFEILSQIPVLSTSCPEKTTSDPAVSEQVDFANLNAAESNTNILNTADLYSIFQQTSLLFSDRLSDPEEKTPIFFRQIDRDSTLFAVITPKWCLRKRVFNPVFSFSLPAVLASDFSTATGSKATVQAAEQISILSEKTLVELELFVKPDDFWDVNEVSGRCENVVEELLELLTQRFQC